MIRCYSQVEVVWGNPRLKLQHGLGVWAAKPPKQLRFEYKRAIARRATKIGKRRYWYLHFGGSEVMTWSHWFNFFPGKSRPQPEVATSPRLTVSQSPPLKVTSSHSLPLSKSPHQHHLPAFHESFARAGVGVFEQIDIDAGLCRFVFAGAVPGSVGAMGFVCHAAPAVEDEQALNL